MEEKRPPHAASVMPELLNAIELAIHECMKQGKFAKLKIEIDFEDGIIQPDWKTEVTQRRRLGKRSDKI